MKDNQMLDLDTRLMFALVARGVTYEEQQTKMHNLERLGPTVIRALTHDWYWVQGRDALYNPYRDYWKSVSQVREEVKIAYADFMAEREQRQIERDDLSASRDSGS